jgi:hypothetical protein
VGQLEWQEDIIREAGADFLLMHVSTLLFPILHASKFNFVRHQPSTMTSIRRCTDSQYPLVSLSLLKRWYDRSILITTHGSLLSFWRMERLCLRMLLSAPMDIVALFVNLSRQRPVRVQILIIAFARTLCPGPVRHRLYVSAA